MLIDIHTHATLYKIIPLRDGRYFITPDELVATMDQAGIDMAVVLPLVSPAQRTSADLQRGGARDLRSLSPSA